MDFRFTISIEGLGARDVAEDNADALLDAFQRTRPAAGPAVGANLETEVLEVTFCASGDSLDEAAKDAAVIFVRAATESGLSPAPLVGFEVEIDLAEPRPRMPRIKRRRGADSWTMPDLVHVA